MTRKEVVELMKSSKNVDEWNLNCDKVKEQFQGQYPDFWYEAILVSGVYNKTVESWK